MRASAHDLVQSAARAYGPIAALFAFALLALRAPGEGVGFAAGLAFALMLALHLLVYGAEAARAAFPPLLARIALGAGVAAALIAAGAPALEYARQISEAGLFAATGAGASLILSVLAGRAPTLRDEDW